MTDIRVPRLNSNDESYLLVEWLHPDGAYVPVGGAVAVIDTSKATTELTAEAGGFLRQLRAPGTECAAGDLVGRLVDPAEESRPDGADPRVSSDPVAVTDDAAEPDLVITLEARKRMEQLAVSPLELRSLGKRVIRAADIDQVARVGEPSPPSSAAVDDVEGLVRPLSRRQQEIWRVVAASRETIPTAFVSGTVHLDAALAVARELSRERQALIGLTELVVKSIAGARGDHWPFFASPTDTYAVRVATRSNIGVTLDAGGGLSVAVVHGADGRSVEDIARTMSEYRMKAIRDTFRPDDLSGANILLSLNNDEGVDVAIPIVFPGTACAVSLGGLRRELRLADDGSIGEARVATLGIAYDHRVATGRQAAMFLKDLKRALESTQLLLAL